MKKFLIIFLSLFLIQPAAFSKAANSKSYHITADNAFLYSISSLNKLNFDVVEMQAQSGYILFKTPSGLEYFIAVSKIDANNSNIKLEKVKMNSPVNEIRELFYATFASEILTPLKRADNE